MDTVFYTESPQLTNRDADGKFAPKFGAAWAKKERRRMNRRSQVEQRKVEEHGAFLESCGIDADEAKWLFA